jgi:tRNA-splicing ligase RtcB
MTEIRPVGGGRWEIPKTGGMRVPGLVFATEELVADAIDSHAVDQVANVAYLPGIVDASMAMPDIHWGYGFPIGGVAATDVENGGVVSPGGVGFDICCGVRLLASGLSESDFATHRDQIMNALGRRIPRGPGEGGVAPHGLLRAILSRGAEAAVTAGYGTDHDLERCEEHGRSAGADPGMLSDLALRRGSKQIGSLGGGNHFLEIQVVDEVLDRRAAEVFGIEEGAVCVMIHCGSRGLGHQTCTDHLKTMGSAMSRHGIEVPDRQLACVPVDSAEGSSYVAAMNASANFAWANRHVLAHAAREGFAEGLGAAHAEMPLVYDVAHNLAKIETHTVGGRERRICVHRKGATRAFGPGDRRLPEDLRRVGQPVLVPGSMGTASWVLRGVESNPAFGSAAHGAGRVMSRKAASKRMSGSEVRTELESEGIAVRPGSTRLLSEEAPYAYKDVDAVAEACEIAGLAARVARLRPLGVVKG